MKTLKMFTFTREEVVSVAAAALDHWDFDLVDSPEIVRQVLTDIVEGRDDVAADAERPAEWRSNDVGSWLHDYVVESERGHR